MDALGTIFLTLVISKTYLSFGAAPGHLSSKSFTILATSSK